MKHTKTEGNNQPQENSKHIITQSLTPKHRNGLSDLQLPIHDLAQDIIPENNGRFNLVLWPVKPPACMASVKNNTYITPL